MKIILMGTDFRADRYKGWHILTTDLAATYAARAQAGRPDDGAALSVTPLTPWMRLEDDYAATPQALAEFREHLAGFVDRNRETIGAKKLVINLNGRARPLPFSYVKAVGEVFRSRAIEEPVEIVIFTRLQP